MNMNIKPCRYLCKYRWLLPDRNSKFYVSI